MIQTLAQLTSQINKINDSLDGMVYIQKIYSTSFYICMSLRAQGKTWYLYIGRGHGKEGVWLDDKKPESFLRKRDKFLEYFRKHLSGSQFVSLTCDELDRIFTIDYHKWGHKNRLFVFYNGRNLHFCHHHFDQKSHLMKNFVSWTMKTEITESLDFEFFDEIGRTKLDYNDSTIPVKAMSALLAEEKKQALAGSVKSKSLKFYNRKKKRIQQDLKNVSEVGNLKDLAENQEKLEKLPMKNNLNGVRLKFQYSDYYKRRDEVYTKIKKLKKAEQILSLRLKDTDDALKGHGEEVLINNLKTTQVVWKNSKSKITEKKVESNQYKIIDLENIVLAIGTTAIGNDQIRSEWAKKADYWFHLDGDKSPHIIIKLRNESLDSKILDIAGSALIEFSQFEYSIANILYTQVKNLKGVKGATGKVIYKKEKRVQVDVNPDWRTLYANGED